MAVHRGSMGVFLRPADRPLSSVVDPAFRLVVLEAVTNPINMGVIARTAAGLGVDGLVIDPTSVDPYYRRASRVSMGEVFDLPFARAGAFPQGLEPLRSAGFELVALTPVATAEPIGSVGWAPDHRVALVLGAEGPGLRPATLEACERHVRIPLSGGVDSLNVGAAAAVALWELTRKEIAPGTSPRV
jgi:tRNA G18 (ribose-2'-O)-methylase SpoU